MDWTYHWRSINPFLCIELIALTARQWLGDQLRNWAQDHISTSSPSIPRGEKPIWNRRPWPNNQCQFIFSGLELASRFNLPHESTLRVDNSSSTSLAAVLFFLKEGRVRGHTEFKFSWPNPSQCRGEHKQNRVYFQMFSDSLLHVSKGL